MCLEHNHPEHLQPDKTNTGGKKKMPLLPKENDALRALNNILEEKYNILDFRIYGSKAKGTDVQGSDIDIMIVLEDHSSAIASEIDDLIFDINLKYDCLISALYFGRNELESGPLAESPIYKKIMQEGVPL
jgi:predicted nucleotidyltransferase